MNKQAFTLIELLIVIAIIAILASLIFPAVNASRQKAQATKCMSQLRQWGIAMTGYLGDREGVYPTSTANQEWYRVLAPYAGASTNDPSMIRPGDKSLFSCPSASAGEMAGITLKITYAMNNLIHVNNRTTGPIGVPTLRPSQLGRPGSFPVMFDSRSPTAFGDSGQFVKRHRKDQEGNILFADGSVSPVTNIIVSAGKTIHWNPENAVN